MQKRKVRVRRRRRKSIKRPLLRRRPGLVILVMVRVVLAALLIVAAVSGLMDEVGKWIQSGQEDGPMVTYDPDEEECVARHEESKSGENSGFTCDMPCSTCHGEGSY